MIELPEAVVIAAQMTGQLKGKHIDSAIRGNVSHKFAFYSRTPEEYGALLKGKTMGPSSDRGAQILALVEPDYALILGGGGERISFHQDEGTLPKKHHLLLRFEDGTYLTVTVQGWGYCALLHQSEVGRHQMAGAPEVSPLSDEFTLDYFKTRFGELEPNDSRSVKYFMISKPGVWGVGNGCLQDILFWAKIHPRRRAIDLAPNERRALYQATRKVLKQAVKQGGRESERDLYGRSGKYHRILDNDKVGQPCPACGTPIEKIFYLGGAAYFCPQCQV